jgi:glycosyltransferase involved in cell wall biosynthesis
MPKSKLLQLKPPKPKALRVAALVDLPRSAASGGHVKCWERLASAAAHSELPLDLTVYFSGPESDEVLGPHARIRQLPPVFSTKNLKFLPYIPDHTDLASYHPRLAKELSEMDVIHTTDGFFAFAQTAERVSSEHNIPLITSFHTDTPSYTRIFTKQVIDKTLRWIPPLRKALLDKWKIPERQGRKMDNKLQKHVSLSRYALVTRDEDHALAENIIGKRQVHHLRLGVDKTMFGPYRRDRAGIERDYNIPPGHMVVLFVGRVDVGKNIYVLIDAMEKLIAEGVPLHLITAGVGPALKDVEKRLADHVTTPGYVEPVELARLYASVDVLALSSEVEIRSMAGVEAMASGCPVLVSEKSGVAQLFEYTPAMRVVESGAENWANALRELAASPDQRRKMQTAAIRYSRDFLASWQDVLAEDLFSVWVKAIKAKLRAAA